MSLINPIWTWSPTYIITNTTGATTYAITDTNLYILVVTFSTQDNTKMLQQLKSYFKRTINRNKCHSKVLIEKNANLLRLLKLDYFINPRFQRVNKYCVLLFEDYPHRVRHTNKTHFLGKKKIAALY